MAKAKYLQTEHSVKISSAHKKLIIDGSQSLKQTEKTFMEKAIEEHHKRIHENSSIIQTMKKSGLI